MFCTSKSRIHIETREAIKAKQKFLLNNNGIFSKIPEDIAFTIDSMYEQDKNKEQILYYLNERINELMLNFDKETIYQIEK